MSTLANAPSGVFSEVGIRASAPASSGVYAIYNRTTWIYVGESNDIQRRLLEHVGEVGTCINRSAPASFCYETVAASTRVQRQNGLILELRPSCNQRLG